MGIALLVLLLFFFLCYINCKEDPQQMAARHRAERLESKPGTVSRHTGRGLGRNAIKHTTWAAGTRKRSLRRR